MKRLFAFATLLVLGSLILAACAGGSPLALGSTSCGKQACVKMKVSEPVCMNEPVQVTISVETDRDWSQAALTLITDNDYLIQLEGPRTWRVDTKAHQPLIVTTSLRFLGEALFLVGAEFSTPNFHQGDSLNVLVTKEGAVVRPTFPKIEPPPPTPTVTAAPLAHPVIRSVSIKQNTNLPIPGDGSWLTYSIAITTAPITATVSTTNGRFYINHPRPQDLIVEFVAPDGKTVARVWNRQIPAQDNFEERGPNKGQFLVSPPSDGFKGQSVNGNWVVRIRDQVPGEADTFVSFSFVVSWIELVLTPQPTTTPPPGLRIETAPPGPTKVPPTQARPESSFSPSSKPVSPSTTASNGWNQMMTEDFENVWPNGGWSVLGSPTWDDWDYKPFLGYWSVWCAGSSLDPWTGNYENNMNAWTIYGPFDLSDAKLAELDFWYWNQSEAGYDFFDWLVSVDGTNFYNFPRVSGDSGGWKYVSADLANVPGLGDVTGRSSVWIAYNFISDDSVTSKGTFIDTISLWKYVPGYVTAQGYLHYNERNATRSSARSVRADLFTWDQSVGYQDTNLRVFTDSNGFFQFPAILNWNDKTKGPLNLQVWWNSYAKDNASTHQVVMNTGNYIYQYSSDLVMNVPSGVVDFSRDVPDTASFRYALWLLEDLRRGWQYIASNANDDPGSADLVWEPSNNDPSGGICGNSPCFLAPYIVSSPTIFVPDQFRNAPDMDVHELGHNYLYRKTQWWYWAPDCWSHSMFTATSSGCGWSEGWADFFALPVNYNYVSANGDTCFDRTAFTPCGGAIDGDSWDLEAHSRQDDRNRFPWGDTVEGRVAGTLWDMHDNAQDGSERAFFGFAPIWSIVRAGSSKDQTIQDFWTRWKAAHNDQHTHSVPDAGASVGNTHHHADPSAHQHADQHADSNCDAHRNQYTVCRRAEPHHLARARQYLYGRNYCGHLQLGGCTLRHRILVGCQTGQHNGDNCVQSTGEPAPHAYRAAQHPCLLLACCRA